MMRSVIVVSNDKEALSVIHSCFGSEARVAQAATKEAALDLLWKRHYDFLFVDIGVFQEWGQGNGYKAVLQPFWRHHPTIQIIVMSPQQMIREAVRAVKAGASDYLTYPLTAEEVKYVADSIRESVLVQSELNYLRDQFWESDLLDVIQTKNPQMRLVYEKVRSVAPTKSTVLLVGETGTGKGVMANLIHRHSNRRDSQFISVHCGAIPDTLVESELFGHEKGAFTGAVRRKLGKFEIASGGTIFLDEIGTITPTAQIKLLQVLQDGNFQRVGGEETINANVRVIAATNMDLKKMSEEARFRIDLYYRFNVFPIQILPLRERIEDIPHLVEIFLEKMNRFNTKGIQAIDPQVLEAFKHYPWPGNIRELENMLERAYILETSSELTPENFPSEVFESKGALARFLPDSSLTLGDARRQGIELIERNYIRELLLKNKGKIKASAEAAGITTRQLHKLMVKYGIRKENFKSPAVPYNH
jgi:DNA-binding NtrC family response regulator